MLLLSESAVPTMYLLRLLASASEDPTRARAWQELLDELDSALADVLMRTGSTLTRAHWVNIVHSHQGVSATTAAKNSSTRGQLAAAAGIPVAPALLPAPGCVAATATRRHIDTSARAWATRAFRQEPSRSHVPGDPCRLPGDIRDELRALCEQLLPVLTGDPQVQARWLDLWAEAGKALLAVHAVNIAERMPSD